MNFRSLMRQPVLTVAIHPRELRWSVGRPGHIRDIGRIALPAGLIADGVVTDPEAAGRLIREDAAFMGRGRMRAVVALPAQRSVFRQLEVPALGGKQFNELVEREIRRELPMLAENAHVSWSRAGSRGNNALVFVIGVARDVLDSHVAALRAAGLHAASADLRIIAAARSVGQPDCVIASVDEDEVELGIFRDGVPAIIRYVAMTARPDEGGWADQLAEELARTLKFYRDSHRDDVVVPALPVTFVGAAARRALLAPQIAAATGHDVAMPPLRLQVQPEQETVVYAANVGLALKDLAA